MDAEQLVRVGLKALSVRRKDGWQPKSSSKAFAVALARWLWVRWP